MCTLCNKTKPIEEFLKDKAQKKGYRNQCKECLRKRNNKTYHKRKDSLNKNMRDFRSTVKGATTTSFCAAKLRARKENLPFDIDLEYTRELWDEQEGKCALTGEPFVIKGGWLAPSLDKIDPEKGYTKGNIQWLTQRVNLLKSNMTNEELLIICKLIINSLEK